MSSKITNIMQARAALYGLFGHVKGDRLYALMCNIPTDYAKLEFINNLLVTITTNGNAGFKDILNYKVIPVGIREFICSPFYLNKESEVYPYVLDELEKMNNGSYVEVVLTGGIGSAKTTCALYSQAYQLYLLSCMVDPHKSFGLDSASEIKIIFQSLNAKLAKDLDYTRFKTMIQASPYFNEYFPYDKNIESKLVFPNRIEVEPVSGQETAAIGQNVIGGIIDEINFMAIVEKSKQSADGTGEYNQANSLYNSIARRRKSRFAKAGKVAGLLCLVSSKRFPNQFTDVKTEEAKRDVLLKGKSDIYIYDKRVWDVKPSGTFSDEKFPIFIGDDSRQPKILTQEEADAYLQTDDAPLIDFVPMDFRKEFEANLIQSIQDIAGHSTLAKHPFFVSTDKIGLALGKVESIIIQESVDFDKAKAQINTSLIKNKDRPRHVHLDLSLTGDSAGIACGYVEDFALMERGDYIEYAPKIVIDFVLEVVPPKGGEIKYYKIRELLYTLRKLGVPIKWVTADSFQSSDMLQILQQNGFKCGQLSMDTSMLPYELLKSTFYDERLSAPKHKLLNKELLSLEKDTKKGKIDHPATSSKDVSDSLAGVVAGLTRNKQNWLDFKIPIVQHPKFAKEVK